MKEEQIFFHGGRRSGRTAAQNASCADVADNGNRFAVYDAFDDSFKVDMGYGEIRVTAHDAVELTQTDEILSIKRKLMKLYARF